MKKIQYGILVVILPLVLAFSFYFSPSKPLSIVKDIGQQAVEASIDAQETIVFKGNLYFFRETLQTGRELWSVDNNNNVSLAFETIPGRGSASIQALFESNGILYLIVQVPNEYTSLIYYLEDPQGEFKEIDPSMYVNTYYLKKLNGKYFTLTSSANNNKDTIVEFDGPNTKFHTITGNNWIYTIEDFTYYNNELYYSWNDGSLRELRKITNNTQETLYSSDHVISFLYTTTDGIYFIERNYEASPSSYDLSLLRGGAIIPLKRYSTIDFARSRVVDDSLLLIGASVESQINQLWKFSGTEQKQITDYQVEHYFRLEDHVGKNNSIYFFEEGSGVKQLKYSDGVSLYDVNTGYEYYNSQGSTGLLELGGNFLISGRKSQGETISLVVAILENGKATEVLDDQNTYYYQLFMMDGELYALATKKNAVVELYKINPLLKVATLEVVFEGEHSQLKGVDDMNRRAYLTYTAVGEYGSPLSVIDDGYVQKLPVTDATGGSYPRKYTIVKGKTYFIAKHDEYGETIWESDGYDAKLIDTSFNENPNLTPDKLFSVNDNLVYTLKEADTGYLQFWVIKDGEHDRLSQNSFYYVENSIINTGTQIYLVAGYNGSQLNNLLSIDDDKVEYIVQSDFTSTNVDFIKTPHGIFFITGTEESTAVWQLDGSTLIQVDVNGAQFTASHGRKFLWDSNTVYLKECIDDYSAAIYKITDNDRLETIDIGELSGKRCTDLWFFQLDNENVISLIDHSNESMGLWSLKDGKVMKIDSFGIPFHDYFVVSDSRLYFNARPLGSPQTNLFVYQGGITKNLNLGLASIVKIAKGSQEEGTDWLLYKEQYTNNGYQLYKYDGNNISLINSIPVNYHDIYKVVKVGGINFIQIGSSSGDDELIALDGDGQLNYLNSVENLNFGTNGSYTDNLMAKGHGKWLFLQGCNYLVGCEPFSLNLNQFPEAQFTTDKNHYLAGYEVVVDGSESTDPENNILEYNWKLTGYDNAQIVGNGTAQAVIKLPLIAQDSELTIELEIIDDGYDRSVTSKSISVEVNHAPEIVINAPNSVVEGSVVKLDASASSDVEGEALSFLWSILEGENIVLNNSNQAIASFTVPELEEDIVAKFKVAVRDSVGNISEAELQVSLEKAEGTIPNPDNGSDQGDSGGGGSTNWLLLLMLASLVVVRFGYHRR